MLDDQTAIATLAITRLINDWGYDLDLQGGMGVAALCTSDVAYFLAGTPHRGREAVTAFYTARNERVAAQQKDGVRTQRHAISNIRPDFRDDAHASATFLLVNYSGEGKPPILDLKGPTIVADVRMDFVRESDGAWRIALFDSTPLFVGNDPFLNASVMQK